MELIVLPVLLLMIFVPAPPPSAAKLADFARFSKALGQPIAIVDPEGVVREGVLVAASANDVTMQFGSSERIFQRDVVASANRLRDGRRDGAIKGLIFGALNALAVSAEYQGRGQKAEIWATCLALYGVLGYGIDAAVTNRQPLYKASLPPPAVKVSLRF